MILKKKNFLSISLILISIICYILIIHRFWFFEKDLIVGHLWDQFYPDSKSILNFINELFLVNKNVANSGMETTGLFTKMYFYTFILLFDTSLGIKIFTLSIHIISFYGFIFFLESFLKKKNYYIYLLSFLYAFSPLLLSFIITGFFNALISYAIAPIFIRFFFEKKNFKNVISIFFLFNFLISYLHIFILVFIIILIIVLAEKKSLILVIKNNIALYTLLLIPHLFFFYVEFISLESLSNPILDNLNKSEFLYQSYISNGIKFIDIILGLNFWDRNFYLNNFNFYGLLILYFFSIIFYYNSIYLNIKYNIKLYVFFFILFIFLAKGSALPFSSLTLGFLDYLNPFINFRSNYNFVYVINFLILLIISKNLNFKIDNHYKFIFFAFIVIQQSGWIINGKLGFSNNNSVGMGPVFYKKNDDIINAFKLINDDSQNFNVVIFPNARSVFYEKKFYNSYGQGTDNNALHLNKKIIYDVAPIKNQNDFKEYLFIKNVKYIIFRNDINHHFKIPGINIEKSFHENSKILLKKVVDNQTISIFKNENLNEKLIFDCNMNSAALNEIYSFLYLVPVKNCINDIKIRNFESGLYSWFLLRSDFKKIKNFGSFFESQGYNWYLINLNQIKFFIIQFLLLFLLLIYAYKKNK